MNISAKTKHSGFTLVEMMVALIIMGVIVTAFIGGVGNLAKGVFQSRARMLASNLAQEKMQILKQMSYYKQLITPSPSYRSEFTPAVPYDTTYFQPESILEGGTVFERLTNIEAVQEVDGDIQYLSPGTMYDTGIKVITVTVIWNKGGANKKVQVRSIASNPEITATNSIIKGTIKNSVSLAPIQGVNVNIAENIGWMDITDVTGNYSMNVMPGSYMIMVNHDRYWPESRTVSVAALQTVTQDFNLTAKSSGSAYGNAWINDHLVITEVVGSTVTDSGTGFDQEYVELFNPTTYEWRIAADSLNGIIGLKYQKPFDPSPKDIPLKYNTLNLSASTYYLIANTNTITACGVTRVADAYYRDTGDPDYPNIIKVKEDPGITAYGGVGIYRISGVFTSGDIDVVGWDFPSTLSPYCENDGINMSNGLQQGQLIIRRAYPNWYPMNYLAARCMDYDNNNLDFYVTLLSTYTWPVLVEPRNITNNQYCTTVVSGRPAFGAIVSCNDGLSSGAIVRNVGTYNIPTWNLVSIGTGTWSILISSNNYSIEISTVVIKTNISTGVPNGITSPKHKLGSLPDVSLSETLIGGYITGRVTNAMGVVISPPITLNTSGRSAVVNTNGYYSLQVPSGTYSVTANPNNMVQEYISSTLNGIIVDQGMINSGNDFRLSQGGALTGFVTRDGVNPVPYIAMTVFDRNDILRGEAVTDSYGRFKVVNLSTGPYFVGPVLDSGETSSPVTNISTITVAGSTVFTATFTISGAFGSISGSVTDSGQPIRTGVLIVVTTKTITSPPVFSTATLYGEAYYSVNSLEDGTYIVDVRGSTTSYKVYGFYPKFTGDTPVIPVPSRSQTGVSVVAGQRVTGINLAW